MDTKIDEFVNVSLRIRPVISQDNTESSCLQVISKQPPILFVVDRSQTYHFDNIFTEDGDQETVYNETVKPLVEYVKQGYSCTVFAYGQTGTGKTYTMGTSSRVVDKGDAGLIPRALEQFFSYSDEDIETDISVSFIEIYNEKVFDLLKNNNKPPLTVKGFKVQGCSEEKVYNCREAKHFLEVGNKNRHTSETKQNSKSSRSHAVFTIHCRVRRREHETTAKLNLVDLAGCESVKKTGNQGSTFQEGVNINMGLLCIGQVMTALSTNSNFIPYRQSIITSILQDSLNKRNLVSLIACVNGNPEDCNETVQTLEFAQRVKKMKNRPEINEVIMQYKRENPTLFQPVKTSGTPFKRPASSFQTPCLKKRVKPLPLKTINEPLETVTALESPKSLSSISVTSISSHVEATQQNFSPVIKKYMTAMESNLVVRMETLIENTLKRQTRSSLLTKGKENNDGGSTPSMSWNKIRNEVSKQVRTEIAQLTATTARAASSPIEEHTSFIKIRRVLKYESSVLNDITNRESSDNSNNTFMEESVFKVPELPVSKRKQSSKRTPSISPIEFVQRRSTRLSLKRINNDDVYENSNVTLESSYKVDKSKFDEPRQQKKRCSVRLAKRRAEMSLNNNNSLDDFDLESTAEIRKASNDFAMKNRGKSVRSKQKIVTKNKTITSEANAELNVKATPAGKRLKNHVSSSDSPATAHSKHVLVLLNSGNVKQLEKLHSIGPKTAQQILLFREIKGPLDRVSDLSAMPGWHGKKYKSFLEQNFLKDELI